MIPLLLAAALAAAPAGNCTAGQPADIAICKALAAQAAHDPAAAAEQFDAAAAAYPANDPKAARAYAAAGNMWIAANEPGKAALSLDRALAGTGLQAEQRGEALLDRARAAEAQNDLKTARAKVGEASQTISEDPFLWYFSAALAIREGDKATAQSAIGRALTLAPNEPLLLFEAGHVAQFAGDESKARSYWSQAERFDTNGPIGKAAREAMALLAPVPADGNKGPPEIPHR
jgi:tetratricopeptide (TPR) repeat protein